jgi:hypothetical protein
MVRKKASSVDRLKVTSNEPVHPSMVGSIAAPISQPKPVT